MPTWLGNTQDRPLKRYSSVMFEAPYTSLVAFADTVHTQGYAVLDHGAMCNWLGVQSEALAALVPNWSALPSDAYLRDGGDYRQRRHSCYLVDAEGIELVPQRAHWQPVEYNALHGGLHRWFEPISASVLQNPTWQHLIQRFGQQCMQLKSASSGFIEAHQFRIHTNNGIGRPTPEGAHRDGVDYVAVMLIARHNIKGGETRVFEADGPMGQRFTLSEPWSMLFLDDERVIHESTPVQPVDASEDGYRDTLVLTWREHGFLGDDQVDSSSATQD